MELQSRPALQPVDKSELGASLVAIECQLVRLAYRGSGTDYRYLYRLYAEVMESYRSKLAVLSPRFFPSSLPPIVKHRQQPVRDCAVGGGDGAPGDLTSAGGMRWRQSGRRLRLGSSGSETK